MPPLAGLEREVLQAVAVRADAMAKLTARLVSIRTDNPPGLNYKQLVDQLAPELDQLGLKPRVVEIPNPRVKSEPRFAILAGHGEGRDTLYFHGHYDVVPAGDAQFVASEQSGSLFGRGSSDMKSGLAGMIYAVDAVKACGVNLKGRLALAIVPDEETGGTLGARYLTDHGLIGTNGIGMLTPEPTSGVVWNANRGAFTVNVIVKGRPAHVGLQHQGVNAFEGMLETATIVSRLKRVVERRKTSYNLRPARARHSILLMGGRSEGGTNFNVVPAQCHFSLDRRMNPEEDFEVERRRLLDALKDAKQRGVNLEVEILQEGKPSGTNAESPLGRALASSIRTVTGKAARFEMCPGLLEIRFYAEQGVPAFAYGPGILAVSHGPKEYVKLKSIADCSAIYALTALRLLT
jgi:succinyl-diaminopimelate desuccinylase